MTLDNWCAKDDVRISTNAVPGRFYKLSLGPSEFLIFLIEVRKLSSKQYAIKFIRSGTEKVQSGTIKFGTIGVFSDLETGLEVSFFE